MSESATAPAVPVGEELARRVVALASERKAQDPVVLDLRGLSPFTDYFVLLSGRSDRQVKAIVEAIELGLKAEKVPLLGTEGASRSEWVLIDAGDVVAHVFYAPVRAEYDLESLWSDAPRLELPAELEDPGPASRGELGEGGRTP